MATQSLVKDPEKVTAVPEPTDWTEQDYADYLGANPKFERCDISMAAGHALQFWKWYSGAETIGKDRIYSTYHGVFSYAELNGTRVLPDTLCYDAGEEASSSASQADRKNVASGGSAAVILPTTWEFISKKGNVPTASAVVEVKQVNHTINRDECCKWVKFYSDLLSKQVTAGDAGKEDRQNMTMAINHTAFMMGNCLRLMTKDEFDVANHIQRTTKERLINLFKPSSTDLIAAEVFVPPHFKFTKAFKGYITKGTPLSKQLAILFIEGFSEAANESVAGFWKAACVLSLSYTGLGAIGWFVKAHEKFSMSGKDFLKKISIPALGPFIVEYVHLAERPNKKWIFCRLLSDTALANLSSTSMPIATCLFVALSATNTSLTDELWDIVSLARISKIDMATGFAMAEIFLMTRTED